MAVSTGAIEMGNHVVKYKYKGSKRLALPTLWCGLKATDFGWYFMDLEHIIFAIDDGRPPCKDCIKEIIKTLEKTGD